MKKDGIKILNIVLYIVGVCLAITSVFCNIRANHYHRILASDGTGMMVKNFAEAGSKWAMEELEKTESMEMAVNNYSTAFIILMIVAAVVLISAVAMSIIRKRKKVL